jgi:hypothetical protein
MFNILNYLLMIMSKGFFFLSKFYLLLKVLSFLQSYLQSLEVTVSGHNVLKVYNAVLC